MCFNIKVFLGHTHVVSSIQSRIVKTTKFSQRIVVGDTFNTPHTVLEDGFVEAFLEFQVPKSHISEKYPPGGYYRDFRFEIIVRSTHIDPQNTNKNYLWIKSPGFSILPTPLENEGTSQQSPPIPPLPTPRPSDRKSGSKKRVPKRRKFGDSPVFEDSDEDPSWKPKKRQKRGSVCF